MQLSDGVWPDRLPAVEVRIARPTDKLAEVLDFYCGHLGLPELYRTAAHGYQVVMVGLPGDKYHLEFTSHDDGSPGRAPSDENLLVFYFTRVGQPVVARERNYCLRRSRQLANRADAQPDSTRGMSHVTRRSVSGVSSLSDR
jgi:catechol 2,3-dioxygenase-like lactoylglutathione lyase family enzyme